MFTMIASLSSKGPFGLVRMLAKSGTTSATPTINYQVAAFVEDIGVVIIPEPIGVCPLQANTLPVNAWVC